MKLGTILKESFNAGDDQLTDETRLMNMAEWDSMTHMFFITKLEETYSIELTGDEIAGMQTVGDVRKVITAKGKEV